MIKEIQKRAFHKAQLYRLLTELLDNSENRSFNVSQRRNTGIDKVGVF